MSGSAKRKRKVITQPDEITVKHIRQTCGGGISERHGKIITDVTQQKRKIGRFRVLVVS